MRFLGSVVSIKYIQNQIKRTAEKENEIERNKQKQRNKTNSKNKEKLT